MVKQLLIRGDDLGYSDIGDDFSTSKGIGK